MKARYGLVAGLLLLGACGPEAPKPEPATPAMVGEPVPMPEVGMNVSELGRKPCEAFTPAQLATLNYVAEDEWESPTSVVPNRCSWVEFNVAQFTVEVRAESADKYFRTWRRDFDELSVAGIPVLVESRPTQPRDCKVSLGAASEAVVDVQYQVQPGARFWVGDPCGGAFKATEFLVRNFRV